jgi:hypothetical protein
MAIALTGVLSDLTSLLPSSGDLLQQVLLGAGASVVLSGLKSQAGLDAIDPLHLIPRPAVPATATAPAQPAAVSAVIGKSITVAAFASLPAASQAAVLAAGYVIAG